MVGDGGCVEIKGVHHAGIDRNIHRTGKLMFTLSIQSHSKVADITLVIRGSVRNVREVCSNAIILKKLPVICDAFTDVSGLTASVINDAVI